MNRRVTTAAFAAITTLGLAACGGNNDSADSGTTQPPATSITAESEDNGPVVDHITEALDKLDTPWGNVQYKGENEEAVATDVWDLDINERDSSILVFLDEDARKEWEQSVIWLDGISVTYDNVGISLNSGLGKNDSLELAPKLAEELDGRVTTGDTDMFRDDADEASAPDGAPQPTPAADPATATTPTATCALDPIYEAGTTFYSDGTSGFTTACFDQFMTTNGTGRQTPPEPDPATIPYADGGTCPAYQCGYGHDDNGNPNPSSGELQQQWLDQQQ